jgi:hypothetical protein
MQQADVAGLRQQVEHAVLALACSHAMGSVT